MIPPQSEQLPFAEQSRWFAEEVQPHESALRAYLHRRFPSLADIDDIVQESYARLFRARNTGKVTEIRPYLFAIARNTACDLFRGNKIIAREGMAETGCLAVVDDRPDAAETASHDQELELLHAAIRALPARCRKIFTLRKIQGLSHREIAGKLGISHNTVESQVSIALFRCREFLAAQGVSRDRLLRATARRRGRDRATSGSVGPDENERVDRGACL